jgi:hypothetical protein
MVIMAKKSSCVDRWPIDHASDQKPQQWIGWPGNKKFAVLLTHDVEQKGGYDKVPDLMEVDKSAGFRSCFNFVPRRYTTEMAMVNMLAENRFEVGVHGLYHDGKLFSSRKMWEHRMPQVSHYLEKWGAVGFYSPSTIRNLDWLHELDIEYDSSTFDTDPFEPQPDAAGSIFPYPVTSDAGCSYVEIPYTLPQDFTLFVLMREKSNAVWKQKIDWIVEQGGMIHIRTHPDYMNFDDKYTAYEYPVSFYREVLEYIAEKYAGQYWHALPREMSRFWQSKQMAG